MKIRNAVAVAILAISTQAHAVIVDGTFTGNAWWGEGAATGAFSFDTALMGNLYQTYINARGTPSFATEGWAAAAGIFTVSINGVTVTTQPLLSRLEYTNYDPVRSDWWLGGVDSNANRSYISVVDFGQHLRFVADPHNIATTGFSYSDSYGQATIYGSDGIQHIVNLTSMEVHTRPGVQTPVATVPEPETYAMLLAGLGLMGVVARRRKQ